MRRRESGDPVLALARLLGAALILAGLALAFTGHVADAATSFCLIAGIVIRAGCKPDGRQR